MSRAITKPDFGNGVSHPARYSNQVLPVLQDCLRGCRTVLDPMAGTGRIHELKGFDTYGIELESEWADLHPRTRVGNALDLPYDDETFDGVCVSPCYGNRLSDHHNASDAHSRRSYTHDLGRKLHPDNSGTLHWGTEYREWHKEAWTEAVRVLRTGGKFVLNISDHIRGGRRMKVSGWHIGALQDLGLRVLDIVAVATPRLRQGANSQKRVPAEFVVVLRKTASTT